MEENKAIQQVEEEIIDEFSFLDSWDEKYEYIIDLGKRLPDLEEKYKVETKTKKIGEKGKAVSNLYGYRRGSD